MPRAARSPAAGELAATRLGRQAASDAPSSDASSAARGRRDRVVVDVGAEVQHALLDRAVGQDASASTSDGWRLTSCTLRTVTGSVCGPTTTAVCVLTRESSWLVSCSRSSSTWCAEVKVEEVGHGPPLLGGQRALAGECVDEEAVPAVGGDAAGRGVRLRDEALALEDRHLVAHRGARHPEATRARDRSASRPAARSRRTPPRSPGGSRPSVRRGPLALDSTECQARRQRSVGVERVQLPARPGSVRCAPARSTAPSTRAADLVGEEPAAAGQRHRRDPALDEPRPRQGGRCTRAAPGRSASGAPSSIPDLVRSASISRSVPDARGVEALRARLDGVAVGHRGHVALGRADVPPSADAPVVASIVWPWAAQPIPAYSPPAQ